MNENTATSSNTEKYFCEDDNASAKKIGQTIYVATFSFNGNKNWDMASALARLIEQDASLVTAEA